MKLQPHWCSAITLALTLFISAGLRDASILAADAFEEKIAPFTRQYCVDCHGPNKSRGELNLSRYRKVADVVGDFRRWSHVIEFVRDAEMPPANAKAQPTPTERNEFVRALEDILLAAAKQSAGDPGVVPPRRLSNTEYDVSIRDLTGIDLRPTREFPVDPAGGEGFDNTGEALSMSPSLLKKYLSAAQRVSEHLVLTTDGVVFAPHPVNSYNERKKLTEQAIIDFYTSHQVNPWDYLDAAWRFKHRSPETRQLSIVEWAKQQQLSGKYLALVWSTLNDADHSIADRSKVGNSPMRRLGQLWRAIPPPAADAENPHPIPQELTKLRQYVEFCQQGLCYREEPLIRSNAGNWPISHLAFRARTSANRDRFDTAKLKTNRVSLRFDRLRASRKQNDGRATLRLRVQPAFGAHSGGLVIVRDAVFSTANQLPRNPEEAKKQQVVSLRSVLEKHAPELAKQLAFGKDQANAEIDDDSFVLSAPASIAISLSQDVLQELDGKQLLANCELFVDDDISAAMLVQHGTGGAQRNAYANAQLLIQATAAEAESFAQSAERVCQAFPNRFVYVDQKRGLAAGFHLVEGFFRDDKPLYEKVLCEEQQLEIDRLWRELDFVTRSAETLLRGFVWFERSERHVLHDKRFDFLRPEDPELVRDELLDRFERTYLGKMGVELAKDSGSPKQTSPKYEMIHGFFEQIRQGLKQRLQHEKLAEQHALKDLQQFARRAFRRKLSRRERESIVRLYRNLREDGQKVEPSLRGVLVAILMSPQFCYRYDDAEPGKQGVTPLSDDALASRLSYFLWSSIPDEPLLKSARLRQLQNEERLLAETNRMLKSPKIESFAREFFGQWLRFRDYLSKDPVNGQAFPGYTEDLREAMAEEPVRLAVHLIQNDRSITDLLDSDFTFVNAVLAKHYGGEIAKQYASQSRSANDWRRVDGIRSAGRGGLFGMGVILTKNSRGERTSPVRRGFWTVHHLLGQHFPPPPADVPELPPDERQAKATIRQLMTQHTADAKCAMCHKHFDSLGLALEGFDPIGRKRSNDLAGRPIDDTAKLPNGKDARGIEGLIDFISQHRRNEFVKNFCRKFLGYALGRSLILSDQPLLAEMETALQQNDFRFSVLFEIVVLSPQFRNKNHTP